MRKKIETISIGNYSIRFYVYSLIEEQQKSSSTSPISSEISCENAWANLFSGIIFFAKKYAENMKKIVGAV